MTISYLKNGQPFECCPYCGGSGGFNGCYEETSWGTRIWVADTCGKCNGTGNELWMCAPVPEEAEAFNKE